MAAIETLAGVTKLSDHEYEINGVVELGPGIDDIYDSTINVVTGGQLRFRNGCSTKFYRVRFLEINGYRFGNQFWWRDGGRYSRFYSSDTTNAPCAPEFHGCEIFCYRTMNTTGYAPDVPYAETSADGGNGNAFDLSTSFAGYIGYDEHKQPTRWTCYNNAEDGFPYGTNSFYNPSVSRASDCIIDGFVCDVKGLGDPFGMSLVVPKVVKNITIVDNPMETTDDQNHFGCPMTNFPRGDSTSPVVVTINKLKARNIGVSVKEDNDCMIPSPNPNQYVRLLDPVGEISKWHQVTAEEGGSVAQLDLYRGKLVIERTCDFKLLSSSGTDILAPKRMVKINTNSGNVIEDTIFDDTFSTTVTHWVQDYRSLVKEYDNNWEFRYGTYGKLFQNRELEVSTREDKYNFTTTVLFDDIKITEQDYSVVSGYVELTDANKFYDYSKKYELEKFPSDKFYVDNICTYTDTVLNFGDKDIILKPDLNEPLYVQTSDVSEPLIVNEETFDYIWQDTSIISEFDLMTLPEVVNLPRCLKFSLDGTKMFLGDGNIIRRYELSIPHDPSSATYIQSHDGTGFSWWKTSNISFTISRDGSYIAVLFSSVQAHVLRLQLTTPWDLSTMVYIDNGWWGDGGATVDQPNWFEWSDNGLELIMSNSPESVNVGNWRIRELSAPHEMLNSFSTVYSSSFGATGVYINRNKVFIVKADGSLHIADDQVYTSYRSFFNFYWNDYFRMETIDVGENLHSGFSKDANDIGYIHIVDSTGTVKTIQEGHYINPAYITGGNANTVYIKSNYLASTSKFDTIKTTGYVTFEDSASSGLKIIDANGTTNLININIQNDKFSGLDLNGAQVAVFNKSTNEIITSGITNGGTIGEPAKFSGSIIYTGDVYIRIRKSPSGSSDRFVSYETNAYIDGDLSLTITLTKDNIAI